MKKSVFCLGFLMVFLIAPSGFAANGVGFYIEPKIGFSRMSLKSLEIETSFLNPEGSTEDEEWVPIEDAIVEPSVGRKAFYKGVGPVVGVGGGIKLFSLSLGLVYLWNSADAKGYSKRYRFSSDSLGAGGRVFWDQGKIQAHRIVGQALYELPVWKLQIVFSTRLGCILVDEGPLVVGRALKSSAGFYGDVGGGLSVSITSFLKVGIAGIMGFYAYSGKFEGAFGIMSGMEGKIVFHI